MNALAVADREFLDAFEACEIRGADFHHREHLRVAYCYLTLLSSAEALEKMEAGLHRLLAHLGAPASKYHRTLTEAWLHAVRHFIDRSGATADFAEFIARAPQLLDPQIMGTHYSTDLLWSDAARAAFLEPDLQPIPRHVG